MTSARCMCLLLAMCLSMSLAQDGYETFPTVPGSRYKLYTNGRTWAQAVTACQRDGQGAHLVVINSVQEGAAIAEMTSRVGTGSHCYVGMNDISVEGTWMTIEGDPVSESGYNNWYGPNPDNWKGDEDCGVISWLGMYNDEICSTVKSFICEKPDV